MERPEAQETGPASPTKERINREARPGETGWNARRVIEKNPRHGARKEHMAPALPYFHAEQTQPGRFSLEYRKMLPVFLYYREIASFS